MSKKNKPEEIPSWIKDLYKEDLDRVVKGERPMYFRGMDDSPLRNVSLEFDILSGGAAVKGKKGDFIYTLPEKEGSRFVVREGSLNYIADNPYGEDSGEKRLWDDYNVHINKDFRPLNISVKTVIYLLTSCPNGFITLMTQRMASNLTTLSLVLYQPLII